MVVPSAVAQHNTGFRLLLVGPSIATNGITSGLLLPAATTGQTGHGTQQFLYVMARCAAEPAPAPIHGAPPEHLRVVGGHFARC